MRHVFWAGNVERGTGDKRGYRLVRGYSEVTQSGIVYPWLTRNELLDESRSDGIKVKFHDTEIAARRALLAEISK